MNYFPNKKISTKHEQTFCVEAQSMNKFFCRNTRWLHTKPFPKKHRMYEELEDLGVNGWLQCTIGHLKDHLP